MTKHQKLGCTRKKRYKPTKPITNMYNKKFNRLLVLEEAKRDGWKTLLKCKCDCGKIVWKEPRKIRSGHTKSCGCYASEVNSKKYSSINKLKFGEAAKNRVFYNYKRNAKNRGLKFTIDFKYFIKLTSSNCHYCNNPPINKMLSSSNNGDYIYNGLDRINNLKGYTVENVVPCCPYCNTMKGDMTIQEFKTHINKIYKNKSKEIIGITFGVFSFCHVGHINIFKNSKKICNNLYVGVNTDELTLQYKGKIPSIPFDERLAVIDAIGFVDNTFKCESKNKIQYVKKYNAKYLFVGDDHKGEKLWLENEKEMTKLGGSVIYLPHTDGISSSIIDDIIVKLRTGEIDTAKIKNYSNVLEYYNKCIRDETNDRTKRN